MESEINDTTVRNNSSDFENSDDSEGENIIAQSDYDPNSNRKIVCVELQNNQHIYVEYKDNCSVIDLILSILERKEYRKLKQNRNLLLLSSLHTEIFDLALCFYDSIVQPHENRIDKYIMIDKLHELQILKNYRTPFFIMKENFTPFSYIYEGNFQIGQLTEVKNAKYNQYAMFLDYLPRISKWIPNTLTAHPELEDYFSHNRKYFNEFKPYKINFLSCDNNKVDWFIYDRESINFLIEMENKNFVENANLKYVNGKLYFEDRVDRTNNMKELTDEDLNKLIINLTFDLSTPDNPKNIQSKKVKINKKTTAYDLIVNYCTKLESMNSKYKFDPKKKILKVKGLNDYIFDINEPLINFSYLNECIRLNLVPDYLIINNPELVDSNGSLTSSLASSNNYNSNTSYNESQIDGNATTTTINSTFKKSQIQSKFDLKNIASYNPIISNMGNEIIDNKICLEKGVNIKKTLKCYDNANASINQNKENLLMKNKKSKVNSTNNKTNDNNSLESFVDFLEEEVDKEINKKIRGDNTENFRKNDYINNYDYYMNSLFPKKKTFLNLSNNESEYLKIRKKFKNYKINKKTPNIFTSSIGINAQENSKDNKINKKNINFQKRKPLYNREYIKITHIRRPFSILFRSAEINKLMNSYESDQKFTSVLLFKFELYNSNELICPPKQIRWKTTTKVQRPYFNKRIYFDIVYGQLPNFSSIIFKVKNIKYDKNNSAKKIQTVFWANYRLFDQENRLKVGLHKINLHDREVSDDIYYSFNDNPNEESSKIYFEIENFVYPVLNIPKQTKNSKTYNESQLFALEGGFLEKINKIDQKSPFDELNNYEKMTLWRNRFAVSGMASLIPRLFLSCDYNNPNSNQEIEQLTKVINGISVVQAIELLSGRYVNESIRKFAVSTLNQANTVVIQTYLLQLVQALKYEKNHDSALARFLIEKAIANPITIGHEFFWYLRSEMFDQNVQQRFGLYLEVFLNKISRPLYKIFKDEDTLLKNLIVIAEKIKLKKNKEERKRIFKEDINVVDGYLKINKKEVSLPLNFKYRIKGIIADKCRIMKSKKKPLWLTFENGDPLGENIVVMLKCGDDLRMDMVTLQLFRAMQNIWYENGLKLKMSLYKVLCTGNQQGMLEMVTNSETLANIHVKEGGAINQMFSKVGIKKWIEKNCTIVSNQEAIENFMLSNVAYCLSTFVLGIGDRHNDNIMIKKNGELFHIDFGHFLGHFKYKMGIKRERAAFVFTRQFQSVLGGDNSPMFQDFKKKLERGYIILRNNKDVILTLLKILLCTGIPELNEKSLRFLENSLLLKRDDKEAIEYLNRKLYESMDSMSTKLNFAIHIVANK